MPTVGGNRWGVVVGAALICVAATTSCTARSPNVAPVELLPTVEQPVVPRLNLHGVGIGPWSLMMNPTQVFVQPECKPFLPVRVTGGLECPNFETPFGERNISFEFDDELLSKIQLRLYQGDDTAAWIESLWQTLELVGEAHHLVPDELTQAAVGSAWLGGAEPFDERLSGLTESGLPLSFSFVIDPHRSHRSWVSAIHNPRGISSVYIFVGDQ